MQMLGIENVVELSYAPKRRNVYLRHLMQAKSFSGGPPQFLLPEVVYWMKSGLRDLVLLLGKEPLRGFFRVRSWLRRTCPLLPWGSSGWY